MKNIKLILIFFFLFVFFYNVLFSQGRYNDKREHPKEEKWNKIEEYRKLKMLEELKLTDEESLKFYARFITYRNQTKEIDVELRNNYIEFKAIIDGTSKSGDLAKKMENLEILDQKRFDIRKSFYTDIKKILSIEKVARFLIFERNFHREMQGMLRDERSGKRE